MAMEQYGDLSEQEYLELLNEIEDDDVEAATEAETIDKVIAKEDEEDAAIDISKETSGPEKAKQEYYTPSWYKHSSNEVAKARKDIQRAAFNQNELALSDPIPQFELTELIKLLTSTRANAVKKFECRINKRLAKWLRPFIPASLRGCFYRYPQSVLRSPGFLYTASEEYGQGEQIWATPNIPYYIKQGTELDLLKEHKPEMLYTIDKYVFYYNQRKRELQKNEIKYASTIIHKKIKTYYDLLKLNPFWFNKLYAYKFNEPLINLDNELRIG